MSGIRLVLVALVALVATTIALANPTHQELWMCVYKGENGGYGWKANTGNGYHGGLQMGHWFMSHYAPREVARYGYADRWPAALQIRVAERAYRREHFSRRWLFSQWPRTSPPCAQYA